MFTQIDDIGTVTFPVEYVSARALHLIIEAMRDENTTLMFKVLKAYSDAYLNPGLTYHATSLGGADISITYNPRIPIIHTQPDSIVVVSG